MNIKLSNSVSFKICFLLGVDDVSLKNDFKEEYKRSDSLKAFEYYPDALTLRSLSRVRQSFFWDSGFYSKKGKNPNTFSESVESDVSYLKENGIDLEKAFNLLDINSFINYLSDMMNIIKYKVLVDLEVPFVDELIYFFYLPYIEKTKYIDLVSHYMELDNPYNIYIYNGENIKQTLKYCFHSDKNLIFSIHSLLGKSISDGTYYYEYKYRTELGEDLDASMTIDSEILLSQYLSHEEILSVKPIDDVVEVLEAVPVVETVVPEIEVIEIDVNEPVEYSNISVTEYIEKNNVEIFVDCDNVEFFKFMGFLSLLENTDNIKGVVLVIDEKSNYLWRVFNSFYTGSLAIRSVFVPRLKEQKSVADIVLTKEVCHSVYVNGVKNILLFSSDSDFFGLVSALPDISFGVCYVSRAMSTDYLSYLRNRDIPLMDLKSVDSDKLIQTYREKALSYYLLNVLTYLPINGWSIAKIADYVYDSFISETDSDLNLSDIEKFVNTKFDKVQIGVEDDKTVLSLDNISIVA